jgi:hypothetical protein
MTEQFGPYDNVRVGTALITLVEPHRGHEVDYNRWYERDHFYAGCMIGAGWFAGRRWVATRALKDLRGPADSAFLPDPAAGSYLATYWVDADQTADAIAWGSTQVRWLHEHDRMFPHRDHIHTLMYVYRWAAARDADPVPTALALDHPYAGLVIVMVDRDPAADRKELQAQLESALPSAMAGTAVGKIVAMTPIPLPEGAPVTQPPNPGQEHRTALLCFCDDDPAASWDDTFGDGGALRAAIEGSGQQSISWIAPFVPTVPGTDRYTDQLW